MTSLPISVLKFGSSVLRGSRDLGTAVHEIYRELRAGRRVVAVVSAFEGETDRLIDSARSLAEEPNESALALCVSTAELQSVAALVIALERAGVRAAAFDASRAGIATRGPLLDADPCGLDARAIERELDRGAVVVLPGFVGRDASGSTSLLGRGGSDLSALFVAHELSARTCRLLKDVDGVYDSDPAADSRARRFDTLTFADARELGGRVVQPKAIRFAEEHCVAFEVARPGSSNCTHVGSAETTRAGFVTSTRLGWKADTFVESRGERRPLRVGLLGLGTVGVGVYRELARQPDRFDVRRVLVRRRRRRAGFPARKLTIDIEDVLAADCDVIVEVLGGVEPASSAIDAALERGIAVITANKAAVALHGQRWRARSAERGVCFAYSAAVGGAVPMLEVVRALARDQRIVALEGVLNATTNFVLDLVASGLELDAAVARARELGYCEADPRTDLDGTDAAHKLELLAREAFDESLPFRWSERAGIDELSPLHVRVAHSAGQPVRLVASCTRTADGIAAAIAPRKLDATHPLASVRGAGNALVITLENGESIVLTGLGAGRWPTTESVIGDLLELSRSTRGETSAQRLRFDDELAQRAELDSIATRATLGKETR
jgi:homoserine dehydrogenase